MRQLKLILTPRAEERMKSIGGEFRVYLGQAGAKCGGPLAALVKSGSPAEEYEEDYTALEKDGVTVWVPDTIDFINDEVVIDLQGISFMVVLVALSAIIVQGQSLNNCASCSGCSLGQQE